MTTEKRDVYDAAREAAEAVRQFNHDSLNAKAMTAPEISSAVRAIADLVDRLPQALDQLARHLERQQAQGQVRMEDGRDAAAPVDQVVTALRHAAGLAAPAGHTDWNDPAGDFSRAIHDASSWLFNMGAPFTPDEDDEDQDDPAPDPVFDDALVCGWIHQLAAQYRVSERERAALREVLDLLAAGTTYTPSVVQLTTADTAHLARRLGAELDRRADLYETIGDASEFYALRIGSLRRAAEAARTIPQAD
ncbi:hypothetical protein [Kitasatospora indigofera]|uniref:hypothetical protein n=1 Tax=Kitasatospora indigofera TaxID=67307 RepID=UPI0033A7B8C6